MVEETITFVASVKAEAGVLDDEADGWIFGELIAFTTVGVDIGVSDGGVDGHLCIL